MFCSGQTGLGDLTGGCLGQSVEKFDVFGTHEILEMSPATGQDLVPPNRRIIHDHKSLDGLAQNWIRDANYRHFHHPGETVEHTFDLFGGDFFAAGLDDVILASHKIHEAIFVHPKKISAQTNPFAGNLSGAVTFGRGLGSLPVTTHNMSASDNEFTHLARRQSV